MTDDSDIKRYRLFAEGGFDTRVCVGYEEREEDGTDPILCFVCSPSDRTNA